MYFFDTNVFIPAANKTTELFDITNTVISEENWLTSKIVVDELKNVYKRRNQIYSTLLGIISNNYSDFNGKCVGDLYIKCFRSSLGSNKNDGIHIEELYRCLLKETELNETDTLNREKLERILYTIKPLLDNIRRRFFDIDSLFKKAEFYDKHVVPEVGDADTLGKSLKKKFSEMNNASKNKQDLKIVADASIYSN